MVVVVLVLVVVVVDDVVVVGVVLVVVVAVDGGAGVDVEVAIEVLDSGEQPAPRIPRARMITSRCLSMVVTRVLNQENR